jgi:hypothetical protein
MYPTGGGESIVILSPRIGTTTPGHMTPILQHGPGVTEEGGVEGDDLIDDDEFNLPVSLALFILFLYMFSGAWVFTVTDNWSFVDAIYFVFISTSTIGFGDLIPQSEWSMIALSVYLLFGLALTSMCINVIQEQLAVAFEEAKLRLGTRMGLEVTEGNPEDSLTDSKSGTTGANTEGKRPGSGRNSKDLSSSQDDSKKRRSKKTVEENNNQNKTSNTSSVTPISQQQNDLASSFEIKKDHIGKNWKERRDEKKKAPSPLLTNHETSASLNPLPVISKPKNDYTMAPLSVSNLTLPVSSSNPSLDQTPMKIPRRPRTSNSPRRTVNFDQKQ